MLDLSRITQKVLSNILDERDHQDKKWGGPTHDDTQSRIDWLEYLDQHLDEAFAYSFGDSDKFEYRRRIVQIAALAVAALESFDRKEETT